MQWVLGLLLAVQLAQGGPLQPTVVMSRDAWAGYQFYLLSMGAGTGTFAVSPDGRGWGFSYCETTDCTRDTYAIALTRCKESAGFDCIVFAHDDQIQVKYSTP